MLDIFNNSSSNSTNNTLVIEFDSYPTDLILEIRNDTEMYYLNNFSSTTNSLTPTRNSNQSLVFSHVIDDCYTITMSKSDDTSNDGADLWQSSDYLGYIIYFNDIIVNYGGYFENEESNTFCTNNEYYCVIPYQCENQTFSNVIEYDSLIFTSYKSYSSVIFKSQIYHSSMYSYGSNAFENSFVNYYYTDENTVWLCYGLNSCLNLYVGYMTFVYANIFYIKCQGYHSCDGTYVTYISDYYSFPTLYFEWYVLAATLFFVLFDHQDVCVRDNLSIFKRNNVRCMYFDVWLLIVLAHIVVPIH